MLDLRLLQVEHPSRHFHSVPAVFPLTHLQYGTLLASATLLLLSAHPLGQDRHGLRHARIMRCSVVLVPRIVGREFVEVAEET